MGVSSTHSLILSSSQLKAHEGIVFVMTTETFSFLAPVTHALTDLSSFAPIISSTKPTMGEVDKPVENSTLGSYVEHMLSNSKILSPITWRD